MRASFLVPCPASSQPFRNIGDVPGGHYGAPVLADTDWFAGRVCERRDAGDHTAFLLDVLPEGSASRHDEPQLGFQRVRDLDAGHDSDDWIRASRRRCLSGRCLARF